MPQTIENPKTPGNDSFNKGMRVAVLGNRGRIYGDLTRKIIDLEPQLVIVYMRPGIGHDVAEFCLENNFAYKAVIAYEGQETCYAKDERDRHRHLMLSAKEIKIYSPVTVDEMLNGIGVRSSIMAKCTEYIIDESEMLFLFFDGSHEAVGSMNYARRRNVKTVVMQASI